MKRHLITGGAGFIGSHLADYLIGRGDTVTVVDNLSTGSLDNLRHLEGHSALRCRVGDVQDMSIMDQLVGEVDDIYHLAASVGVRLIIQKPVESLINNVVGTERLLKCAADHGKPVLITSTSEVYGKGSRDSFSEEDDRVMGATDKARWAYANSKATDEFLALAYHREAGLPVVVVRLFNTVGPRQTGEYGMVIPNFVRQALLGQPIPVHGDGTQTRCFCHVADVVPALTRLLAEPSAHGHVVNLGSREEISIRDLAERVILKTGSPSEIRFIPYKEAYPEGFEDTARRLPDLTRIRSMIGFQPRHTLDDILEDVIRDCSGEGSHRPA